MTPTFRALCALLLAALLAPALHAQTASFERLTLFGGAAQAIGTSGDGVFVVGSGAPPQGGMIEAYRWTDGTALRLGVATGFDDSFAIDVSVDGRVVVGYNLVGPTTRSAFRWTAGGMQTLGTGDAVGVSADGAVVVGTTAFSQGGVDAYRWTAATGMQPLGALPDDNIYSRASGVSSNGDVIVGTISGATNNNREAFRWTPSTGVVALGFLTLDARSEAFGVSPDGNVVVGRSFSFNGPVRAFRWSASGGMQALGVPRDGFNGQASATSLNGEVVVGTAVRYNVIQGTYWSAQRGMLWLDEELQRLGLDLGDLTRLAASAVSADGLVVVGTAMDSSGRRVAWRAVIPREPEAIVVTTTGDEPNESASASADECDVDLTAEDKQCTLRAAIELANMRVGRDSISFAIDGGGLLTIALTEALPPVTDPLVLDATTQTGYTDGAPVVVLDGAAAGQSDGLHLVADGSRVAGLAVVHFGGAGIRIETPAFAGGAGVAVEDCRIGIDASGAAAGNGGGGIAMTGDGHRLLRSVVSANTGAGVAAQGVGIEIQRNRIGTNSAGTAAMGNTGDGIAIVRADATLVGGPGEGNVVSGNGGVGIAYGQADPERGRGRIEGNRVGTDASGRAAIPNAGGGVTLGSGTTLGGTADGAGNTVSGNGGSGVRVEANDCDCAVLGNRIGVTADGAAALGNAGPGIRLDAPASGIGIGTGVHGEKGNVVSGNAGPGILLEGGAGTDGGAGVVGVEIGMNTVGMDEGGAQALPNRGPGIQARGSVGSLTIGYGRVRDAGGLLTGGGNLVSGNGGAGILIEGDAAVTDANLFVSGNLVGGAPGGVFGNGGGGIVVVDAAGVEMSRNTVVGNDGPGIALRGASPGYRIAANTIGVRNGAPAGNAGPGLLLDGPSDLTVGCDAAGCADANTVGYNGGPGVHVASGARNRIGVNALFGNAGLGVDLGAEGPTANDFSDRDDGANGLQNHPRILQAAAADGVVRIAGLLEAAAQTDYDVLLFANSVAPGCQGGGCQQERYLGTVRVRTPLVAETTEGPAVAFVARVPLASLPVGDAVTAVAVDGEGNTSETGTSARTVAADAALSVEIAAGQTGLVVDGVGVTVDVTLNAARAARGAAGGATGGDAADSLFVSRVAGAPIPGPFEGSATAGNGTTVTPAKTAAATWQLSGVGLSNITYSACLSVAGLGIDVPGEAVVVQRSGPGEPWAPRATTLSGGRVCASGLTGFGDLAVGLSATAVSSEPEAEAPVSFGVRVSPNPARGAATVQVSVPEAGVVRVEVYDALGRRVALLHDGALGAGTHAFRLSPEALPAGVYVVRASAGAVAVSRRVTVVR